MSDITHAVGFIKLYLEKREEILQRLHPSDAQVVLFRETRLIDQMHFLHNPQPSPFTNKVMAKLSLRSLSTFWIRPFHKFLQMAVPR